MIRQGSILCIYGAESFKGISINDDIISNDNILYFAGMILTNAHNLLQQIFSQLKTNLR